MAELSHLIEKLKLTNIIKRNEVQSTIVLFNFLDKYNLMVSNYDKLINFINVATDYDCLIQSVNALVIENNFQSKPKNVAMNL